MAHPDWDDQYASGRPLPWDISEPDDHLVELFAKGQLTAKRALEVGCGTGTNAGWLAQQGCEVLGVDISPAAIQRAQAAHPACRFAVADFLEDELAERPFDLVFDRGCFHVFDDAAQQAKFARHVARVLAPGGRWLSLIGSTEGGARGGGPPRRSALDVVRAIEPVLELVEMRAVAFATVGYGAPAAWLCISGRREAPAEPSTA